MRYLIVLIVGAMILTLIRCSQQSEPSIEHLGNINYPSDNLPDEKKIALGKKLFFDKRLSLDNSVSCSSCHKPELAFADSVAISPGVHNRRGFRNAPSILNVGYYNMFMLDGAISSLEMQAIVPIQDTNEMSMRMEDLIKKLRGIEEYQQAAKDLFDRDFDAYVLTRAIAAYERTLVSGNSRFDEYYFRGDQNALTDSEQRGWKLFNEELKCTKCHELPLFTNKGLAENGLKITPDDPGRFRITVDSSDIGKFKIPSLRNVELTSPYMHNGHYSSLEDVVDAYIMSSQNKEISVFSSPIQLTEQEKTDLINFLKCLTDKEM